MKPSPGRAQALWVWWKIFLVFFAAARVVLSVVFPINSLGELLLWIVGIMLLALTADLLCYFVIFKAIFRDSCRRFEEYTHIIARDGLGKSAHDFALREYERCKAAENSRSIWGRLSGMGAGDLNEWSIELAQAKLAMGDAAEARRLLRDTDISQYQDKDCGEAFEATIFKYFSLLISADMAEEDHEAAGSDYNRALPFLEGLSEGILGQSAALVRSEYLIFSERFDEAEEMLGGISSSDRNIMLARYILSGRLYSALGSSSKAADEFNKALGLCPPEQVRENIENQLEKLKSNN